jgi:biopolymer transport protein ExbB
LQNYNTKNKKCQVILYTLGYFTSLLLPFLKPLLQKYSKICQSGGHMNIDINTLKNIADYAVIGILLFMNFLVIWFWIERLMFYKKVNLSTYKSKEQLEIDLTNNLTVISTVGSNAPYIGLLGTVIGIIITFYIIGESGNLDAKVIMKSLALALKATALGLVVAIPATFFYNHLARKVEVLLTKWDILQNKGN